MINVDEALRIILENINSLPPEEVKLINGLDRVSAEDVYSDVAVPPFDNSAMDGYAVRAADTAGASRNNPRTLEVVEDLPAGYLASRNVESNQAIRIMTGAVMPQGADSVVIVEDTKKIKNQPFDPSTPRSGSSRAKSRDDRLRVVPSKVEGQISNIKNKELVEIFKEAKSDENIRKKGEDIKKGELVVSKGTLIGSAHIGILASLGKVTIKVTRKPKVAILATGDEVIDIDEKLEPGKLRSSNTYTLYSQILKCGGVPKNLGIAKDEPEELEAKLKEGLDCDLILTSGGVSVGDYDLVKLILAKIGSDIKFWKVAMKPGKPLVFGAIQGIPIFGLPGNPVSSMVSFEVFVRPSILKMLGQNQDERKKADAVLEEEIKKKKGFRYFLRAQTRWEDGRYLTCMAGPQGSGILKSMALANSLIILPEEAEFIGKGTKVTVRFLD